MLSIHGPHRYLTPEGAFCAAAIEAEIEARYARKQAFIDSYTGEPRAFWAQRCREQIVAAVWDLARAEEAYLVTRLTPEPAYLPADRRRLREIAWADPLTQQDYADRDYQRALVERDAIETRAMRRATTLTRARIARAAARRAKEAA